MCEHKSESMYVDILGDKRGVQVAKASPSENQQKIAKADLPAIFTIHYQSCPVRNKHLPLISILMSACILQVYLAVSSRPLKLRTFLWCFKTQGNLCRVYLKCFDLSCILQFKDPHRMEPTKREKHTGRKLHGNMGDSLCPSRPKVLPQQGKAQSLWVLLPTDRIAKQRKLGWEEGMTSQKQLRWANLVLRFLLP